MDEVEYEYKSSIREALQNSNTERLVELVPSLNEQDASYYIEEWKKTSSDVMDKIRNGQDSTIVEERFYELLSELMNKANISGYHR